MARVFAERRSPHEDIWQQEPDSSRLLHYEVWNRVHARGADRIHRHEAERILGHRARAGNSVTRA